MLSLPNTTKNDHMDDIYILRRQSEHTAQDPQLEQQSYRREDSLTLDNIQDGDILVEVRAISRQDHLADDFISKPKRASPYGSISDLTNSHGMDVERSVTPSSPYMQQQIVDEDPNDAWSLRRRQGTLDAGTGYAGKFTKRRSALFTRNNVRNGTLWMEFTSTLGLERMHAEVGKIAKAMGYQLWRRPRENKLRCIRRLKQRHEMDLVILVGSIRLPEGQVSVVRLRRARGDRSRTESWRYTHFYRELIDRLQRHEVEITAGE